jgi:hypothetical protein
MGKGKATPNHNTVVTTSSHPPSWWPRTPLDSGYARTESRGRDCRNPSRKQHHADGLPPVLREAPSVLCSRGEPAAEWKTEGVPYLKTVRKRAWCRGATPLVQSDVAHVVLLGAWKLLRWGQVSARGGSAGDHPLFLQALLMARSAANGSLMMLKNSSR